MKVTENVIDESTRLKNILNKEQIDKLLDFIDDNYGNIYESLKKFDKKLIEICFLK